MLLCVYIYIALMVKGPANVDLAWVSRAGHFMAFGGQDAVWTSLLHYPSSKLINMSSLVTGGRSHRPMLKDVLIDLTYISILPIPVLFTLMGSLVLAICVFIREIFTRAAPELPTLYFKESPLKTFVINKCKLKDRHYCPSSWFTSRHMQTFLPYLLPKPEVTFEREYLQMRDKGVVALDWVTSHQEKVKRRATVLLVIPPITEGASYVSKICSTGATRGFRVVVFNRRGQGGSYLTTPKLQSFCDPTDLRQVVEYIGLKMVKCPLVAVAYGTGCGLLMSYIGSCEPSTKLTGAVCISPCYDAPSKFCSRLSPFYEFFLLLRLKSLVFRHVKALSSVLDIDKVMTSWSFSEFSTHAYRPTHAWQGQGQGQLSVKDKPGLKESDLHVPVLCVTSLDDPVYACADMPYDQFRSSSDCLLAVTSKGGHCGFLQQDITSLSWSDLLALDYAQAVTDFGDTKSLSTHSRSRHLCQRAPSTGLSNFSHTANKLSEIGVVKVGSFLESIQEND